MYGIDYKEELEEFEKSSKMSYKKYNLKLEEIETARDMLKRGQITRDEFWEKYEGVPTHPLPDEFEKKVINICDYYRGAYGLRGDGVLKVIDYTVFADNPDIVYVVFDTEFRREPDCDYRVVAFPVEIFSNKEALEKFEHEAKSRYERAKAQRERARKKKEQIDNFRYKHAKDIKAETDLRNDMINWRRLKRTYLKDEVPSIVDSLIKRGILDADHRDDYIAYIKCDLI